MTIILFLFAVARGGELGGLSFGLASLGMPLKLRLSRAPWESTLRDYGTNTVLIEPLATFTAVEDFLYSRVDGAPQEVLAAANAAAQGQVWQR